jgi:hypothetical protein
VKAIYSSNVACQYDVIADVGKYRSAHSSKESIKAIVVALRGFSHRLEPVMSEQLTSKNTR